MLQSKEWRRVRHDLETEQQQKNKISQRKDGSDWKYSEEDHQSTFLLGKIYFIVTGFQTYINYNVNIYIRFKPHLITSFGWNCISFTNIHILYICVCLYISFRLSWWLKRERICLQCRRSGFTAWVGEIPWRRQWQHTPVLLPEKFHGQRSLTRGSSWGCQEPGTTEQLNNNAHFFTKRVREISGMPNLHDYKLEFYFWFCLCFQTRERKEARVWWKYLAIVSKTIWPRGSQTGIHLSINNSSKERG